MTNTTLNKSVVHRPTEGMDKAEVIKHFESALNDRKELYAGETEIEKLTALYAKHATDNFSVTDEADLRFPIKQGDILLSHTSSKYYAKVEKSIRNLKETEDRNLQEGHAITGDHMVRTTEGANLTIQNGTYVPPGNITNGRDYRCKIIKSDKPFIITHQEHGNIALPAGTYLARTAINPDNLNIMLD